MNNKIHPSEMIAVDKFYNFLVEKVRGKSPDLLIFLRTAYLEFDQQYVDYSQQDEEMNETLEREVIQEMIKGARQEAER